MAALIASAPHYGAVPEDEEEDNEEDEERVPLERTTPPSPPPPRTSPCLRCLRRSSCGRCVLALLFGHRRGGTRAHRILHGLIYLAAVVALVLSGVYGGTGAVVVPIAVCLSLGLAFAIRGARAASEFLGDVFERAAAAAAAREGVGAAGPGAGPGAGTGTRRAASTVAVLAHSRLTVGHVMQLRAAGFSDAAIASLAIFAAGGDGERILTPEDYETLLRLDDDTGTGRGGLRGPGGALAGELRMRTQTYIFRGKGAPEGRAEGDEGGAGAGAGDDDDDEGGEGESDGDGDGDLRRAIRESLADRSGGSGRGQLAEGSAFRPAVAAIPSTVPGPTPSTSTSSSSLPPCAVCLEDYVSGDKVRILPCLHSFHANCIDVWLQQKSTCPVCKMSIRDPVFGAV
jgi:hypothetical protein